MIQDRITSIHIIGLRAAADVFLPLDGLTVLIGDNGTGKSTIVEALEILRKAATRGGFVPEAIEKTHGAFTSVLRRGSRALTLEVTVEGKGPGLIYGFSVALVGTFPQVVEEWVCEGHQSREWNDPKTVLWRKGSQCKYRDSDGKEGAISVEGQALSVAYVGEASKGVARLLAALEAIEVHVPFETRPIWQQRELDLRQGPRWPTLLEQTNRLARYAVNLPNAFQQLRNQGGDTWRRVVERAQLGLGSELLDFRLVPSGRGNVELEVQFSFSAGKPFPAELLSEGQLSYLSFVALCELNANRSVLAIDEPELHLHPALLARVVWMLEDVAKTAPVVVATHSDRLLDALENPAQSVVLCELDDARCVTLRRPNPARLAEWLADYRGLGSLRAEGYESHVFADAPPHEKKSTP